MTGVHLLTFLRGLLGPWGAPPDGPAWGALACAGLAVLLAAFPENAQYVLSRIKPRTFAGACAFLAALLSLGYVAFYLRGGPRIVDATTYFLQGRALSEGHFAWHVPVPSASFRGRFTLFHDDPSRGPTLAGVFPPGYPLLLSLGFAVGAPLAVGPALAAGIVFATFALAKELAREAGMDRASCESVARVAALLSVTCAALRYHTADTMAHGACALAFACALLAALRARAAKLPWMFLLAGAGLGFVVSARFASSLALGAVVVALAARSEARGQALVACALGAAPGVLLLLIAQDAATGDAFTSTQRAYYAASDGPPGCFRYGFGVGVGCLLEHGDFVRARLMDGASVSHFGLLAALGATARRLGHHLADVANLGPLALVALVPARRAPSRGVRASLALVAALVLAYVPFYFDGDYPGGGARFFADVLPVEHALVALGLAQLASSLRLSRPHVVGAFMALSLSGFAVHMAHAHESLRARDGGHPMYEAEALARAHVTSPRPESAPKPALVLFDTDHGFDLAFDPAAWDESATSQLHVARLRGDDLDRLLYEELGHPPSWVYRFREPEAKTVGDLVAIPSADVASSIRREAAASLEPWTPGARTPWIGDAETWRFESENEWPPKWQVNAWAEPAWVTDTCASPAGNGRVLAVHASAVGGTVSIALPIPHAGAWLIEPRVLRTGEPAVGTLELWFQGHHIVWDLSTSADSPGTPPTCPSLLPRPLEASGDGPAPAEAQLNINVASGTVNLDRILLRPEPNRAR